MNQAYIEDHHGWVSGNDMASRYVSGFGQDADRELAKIHGVELDDEQEPEPIAPMECPRCGRDTPREKDSNQHRAPTRWRQPGCPAGPAPNGAQARPEQSVPSAATAGSCERGGPSGPT